MTDTQPKANVSIGEVKIALEEVFQGCDVRTPNPMIGSFHAEVAFGSGYEIRVILTGRRSSGPRDIHFRFMQRVPQPGKKFPIKVVINEFQTRDPEDLWAGIKDAKAYLLGIVHAIKSALNPKHVPQITSVDDLFKGD